MSLFARLNRTVGAAAPSPPPDAALNQPPTPEAPAAATPSSLAEALARHGAPLVRRLAPDAPPSLAPAPLEAALPALVTRASELGPVSVIPTRYRPDHRHGARPLSLRPLARGDIDLARLLGDPRLEGFDPTRAIYLDIETTGLEHGAGNVAFLIALGWFDGESFQLQQLLLKEPCDEPAMLGQLWGWLEAHPWLVSFNGKSFDLTILQGRLRMHRFCSAEQAALKLRPHLDLLHACRAFFNGRWPDTRLQTLERELLGLAREDDMPGREAPLCYFRFLRTGDAAPLAAIARHNADDVLSMVALATLLCELAGAVGAASLEPSIALNLARRALRQKDPALTLALLGPHRHPDSDPEVVTLATRAEARLGRARRAAAREA